MSGKENRNSFHFFTLKNPVRINPVRPNVNGFYLFKF